ncbi:MAG: signal recognition particle-docking protein FtsY [Firmicutes bacterium]|nr:signal recognition particle-docking protein FtsY [Bacillota bacterium]
MGLFSGIVKALKKTKDAIGYKIASIFNGEFDDEFFEDLEDILLAADVGAATSEEIIETLKKEIKRQMVTDIEKGKQVLRDIMTELLENEPFEPKFPCVIMIVGVNGVGKTTTIGKLAKFYKDQKKSVVIAAGDTFRAAASDQLNVWAERADVRIIKHAEGADPAAVVYDAVASVKAKKTDVLIIDTAGRLHNKSNLMEELKKINRVILREYENCNQYNLIVLDSTTGQNAIPQVNAFNEAVKIDGIVLTKLDGTSKGGVVFAINNEADVKVKFIGTGEKLEDLEQFNPKEFVDNIV